MIKANVPAVCATAALMILAVACDDGGPSTSSGNARVSFYLTDAPGDVEQAWVEIESVDVRVAGEWHTHVPEVNGLIELTTLVDDQILLVGEQEYEAETISEIRLIVGDAALLSTSGEVYVQGDPLLPGGLIQTGTLLCPSCQQTGIKIKVADTGIELDEGSQIVLIDFDIAQSFGHAAGNSGMWVMHPVVHASLVAEVNGDADRIEGTIVADAEIPECPLGVERSIEDFLPLATATTLVDGDGEPIVRAGSVDAEGSFHMAGVTGDVYALGYLASIDLGVATLSFDATVAPTEVTVPSADARDVVYTIVDATCDVAL